MAKLFCLSDAEWQRIGPLLPRGRNGAHRVDNRPVLSGIVHMLQSGARWRDCPATYWPYMTIYNRFNRWSRQGLWFEIFRTLSGSSGIIGTASIDSVHVKVHCSASGGKGGRANDRTLARRPDVEAPCPDGYEGAPACPSAHARQHQ